MSRRETPVSPALLAIAGALAGLVDELVDKRLAALGVVAAEFSSTSLPPNTERRTFNKWCREGRVVGALRDGAGWRCSASAWREARAQGPAKARPALQAANDREVSSEELLRAAGLRRTR